MEGTKAMSDSRTLDDYFASHAALRLLRQNLEMNLLNMGVQPDIIPGLLRVDLIVIRQCLDMLGVHP